MGHTTVNRRSSVAGPVAGPHGAPIPRTGPSQPAGAGGHGEWIIANGDASAERRRQPPTRRWSSSLVSPYDIEDIFPYDAPTVRLPRQQASSTAQNLAVTPLADYTLSTRAWLPSASIVALLEEAGIGSGAARTAISRLFRNQILESSRNGRYSSYRMTTAAAANLIAGGAWIARFGTRPEP